MSDSRTMIPMMKTWKKSTFPRHSIGIYLNSSQNFQNLRTSEELLSLELQCLLPLIQLHHVGHQQERHASAHAFIESKRNFVTLQSVILTPKQHFRPPTQWMWLVAVTDVMVANFVASGAKV